LFFYLFLQQKPKTMKQMNARWLPLNILLLLACSAHAQTTQRFSPDSLNIKGLGTESGSVDVIRQDRMNKGLVTNPLSALNGQAAGVNISNGEDRMAQLTSVRVRGTTSLTGGNDPLIIIDGVYSDLATLSTIYPADIESFAILRNAAETAQYGSRGASGVIEVTTKKGTGAAFHISYDGSWGVEDVYKNIEMLSAAEYVATAKSMGLAYKDDGYNTNFFDAITRTGFVQNHHVAFSGGGPTSSYRASLAYTKNATVIDMKGMNNLVAKLDITQNAFDDFLNINYGVFGSSQKVDGIFDELMLFYSAAVQNPTIARDARAKNGAASEINPPRTILTEKNDTKLLTFSTHLDMTAHLMQGLSLTLRGSYGFNSTENAQFCPTWLWAQGQAYRGERKSESWLANATLDWTHSWGGSDLSLSLLGEYQKDRRTGFWTTVKGFTTNDFTYNNLAAGSIRPYGGTGSDNADPSLASAMVTATYGLLKRYSLSATLRADGSSMVAKHNRWGVFPSVSANWNVLDEAFMQPLKPVVSMLKLRTGYGLTGNLGAISSYTTLNTVAPAGIVPLNGSPTMTLVSLRNANPDLKWEKKSTFNIGADMGFLRNRILFTIEYYYSKTTDMLYQYDVPVPPFTYSKLLANIGSMENRGVEIGLGITPLQRRDMELNINVNMSFQRNKLLSLSGNYNGYELSASKVTAIGALTGAGQHGGNADVLYQIVGQPLGVFYLPHCKGIVDRGNGYKMYDLEDLNNDGKIDLSDGGGDRYIAGQATPKMTLGSNISFRYKAFDISLQMNGAFGHKIFNGTSLSYLNMSSFPDYNVLKGAPERKIVDQNVSDYWLERGDYLNFDYLTVGWKVPVRSRYISALRLSLSVNNLATITSYSGLTPMINNYIVSNTLGIDDKRSYPVYRTWSMGVSIQF
jgi:TonB-linked SusC/RagA family outer membrane protein